MFNKNFYPTPQHISEYMCGKSDLINKVILEPHGGKADLINVINTFHPKEVLTCEIDPNLAVICAEKADRFLGHDFLQLISSDISHIDTIIANPPFDKADKHILHMWEITPEGCEIISLCNWETINNKYSRTRKHLQSIVDTNGSKENLGDCFSDAERKTDVEVGLVHLFKPKTGENEFDGYFDLNEEYQQQDNGIIKHDDILELVNRYVGAVKNYDKVVEMQHQMNELIKPISVQEHEIEFVARYTDSNKSFRTTIDREIFKKELQKSAWKSVFKKFDMERYVTQSVMDNINKFVERQTQVPFTRKNIYKMIEVIVGTHGNTMNKVIVEVFDWLTAHHHDNRLSLEGWKTNSEYVVNKKFIAPYCGLGNNGGYPQISWQRGGNRMDDLMKALCWLTGAKYNKSQSIENFFNYGGEVVKSEKVDVDCERDPSYGYLEEKYTFQGNDYKKHEVHNLFKFKEEENYDYKLSTGYDKTIVRYKNFGKWYEWGFFKIRVYKKGTMHVEFKDKKVWELFNREAAKAKGFQLASKFTSDFKKKTNGVEVY
jgi:hypothetical protein